MSHCQDCEQPMWRCRCNRRGLVVTATGLAIGCHYTRPSPLPSADAEHLQRALLAGPRPIPLFARLLKRPRDFAIVLAAIGVLAVVGSAVTR